MSALAAVQVSMDTADLSASSHALPVSTDDFSAKHVLIVDDEPTIRDLIKSFIGFLGIGHVSEAGNGEEALALAETLQPDLIVCDLRMPIMDGQEFLERLRDIQAFQETPVLMVTGADDTAVRNKLLAAGATNVIGKPIDGTVVMERVRVALEHQTMVESLRAYQQKTAAEFMAAKAIQADLMPTFSQMRRLERSYGLNLDATYQPCEDLGGDMWGFRTLDDQRVMFYLADFSGHGLIASLNTFRLHTLVSRIVEFDLSPSDTLARLNTELCAVLPRGQFAAMFVGVLDIERGVLKYSNAATPEPLFGRRGEPGLHIGNSKGVPLGLKAGVSYKEWKVPFPEGAFMMTYSDALIEQEMPHGPLGTDGLCAFISPLLHTVEPRDLLKATVSTWNDQRSNDLADDLSAFLLMRKDRR